MLQKDLDSSPQTPVARTCSCTRSVALACLTVALRVADAHSSLTMSVVECTSELLASRRCLCFRLPTNLLAALSRPYSTTLTDEIVLYVSTALTDLDRLQTSIQTEGFRSLAEGEPVEYYLEAGDDGRTKAVQVTGPNGAPPQVGPHQIASRLESSLFSICWIGASSCF